MLINLVFCESGNCLQIQDGGTFIQIKGKNFRLDSYSVILKCSGLALNNKESAALSKEPGNGRVSAILISQFFKTPLKIPGNKEMQFQIETAAEEIKTLLST